MTQGIEEPRLLGRLREGQDEAFSELFAEHAPAVRRLAMGIASDRSEAEDITAETFFRVLRAIKRGNGPRDNVRGYLLTVARRVAWEWKGAAQDVPVTDDELTSRAGVSEHAAARTAEHSLISRAFSSLPERWRTVLWQTEVEGAQPAVVAPSFGLSPNATAALARRARLGLRAAYLQAHLDNTASDVVCRSVLEKLGGYTAGSVTGSEARRIAEHLGTCASCRSTHDELRDVCFSLRAHAGGIAVLVPATAAAAHGAGAGAGSGAGSTAALGAGSSTTSGGFAGVLKSAITSTKLKVGLAVASTAAAGIFGVSAGPVMGDAVEVLGLTGQRGAPDGGGAAPSVGETLDRAEPPPADAPVTEREGQVWSLGKRLKEFTKQADAKAAKADRGAPESEIAEEHDKPGLEKKLTTPTVPDAKQAPGNSQVIKDVDLPVERSDKGTGEAGDPEKPTQPDPAPKPKAPVPAPEKTAPEPPATTESETLDETLGAESSSSTYGCTQTFDYYSGIDEYGNYYEVYEYTFQCG